MKGLWVLVVLGVGAGAASAAPAYPDGISGADAARLVAQAMTAAGINAPAPDAPLRPLPACNHEPRVTPMQGSWNTAQLECDSPVAWTRAMRTEAKAAAPARKAGTTPTPMGDATVVTLRRALAKGAMITAEDLEVKTLPTTTQTTTFANPADLIGRRLRTTLGAGTAIQPRQLEPDFLVTKGGPLVVSVLTGGMSVSVSAEALEDGQMGDMVKVRNLESGQTVRVIVIGRNNAEARPNMR